MKLLKFLMFIMFFSYRIRDAAIYAVACILCTPSPYIYMRKARYAGTYDAVKPYRLLYRVQSKSTVLQTYSTYGYFTFNFISAM